MTALCQQGFRNFCKREINNEYRMLNIEGLEQGVQ
jgi:hypothetical protein